MERTTPNNALSRGELLAAAAHAADEARWADATAYLREASFLDPSDAACFTELGRAHLEAGDLADALAALERAVRLDPESAAAQFHLGRAKLLAAEPEAAAARFRRALALDPVDRLGARAALEAAAQPVERLSAPFVRTLFDRYADRYEDDMAGPLRYRGPQVLRSAWNALSPGARDLDVLDLGCGTGLAGLAFRDVARRLAGVDLAPRAIEKARARGIYDELTTGDALDVLTATDRQWDLIVAADVLPYLGDCTPFLCAALRALRHGGGLLATCERAEQPGSWRLGETRRFAHGIAYMRQTAERAGFTVQLIEESSVRHDQGWPVPGIVLALRRSDAP